MRTLLVPQLYASAVRKQDVRDARLKKVLAPDPHNQLAESGGTTEEAGNCELLIRRLTRSHYETPRASAKAIGDDGGLPTRRMKTQIRDPIKTTRFTAIVEAVGRPDVHVLLTAPEDDKVLQAAIKQNRIMTIEQGRDRGKMDRGSIGFSPGQSRQFLIFPKSLARFAGSSVVAIKYDLLKGGDERVPSPSFVKPTAAKKNEPPADKRKSQPSSAAKIIPFTSAAAPAPPEPAKPAQNLQSKLQDAISLLTQEQHGAALNLLKRILKDLRQSESEASKPGGQKK
jgi:hypothetical protein